MTEPLALMKRAVAAQLGLQETDALVAAIAVAIHDSTPALLRVVGAGYGRVSIAIEGGWIKGRAVEVTELPEPAHRKQSASGRGGVVE